MEPFRIGPISIIHLYFPKIWTNVSTLSMPMPVKVGIGRIRTGNIESLYLLLTQGSHAGLQQFDVPL